MQLTARQAALSLLRSCIEHNVVLAGPLECATMSDDETGYRLMRLLEANPQLSQRDAARELGISLGKLNYCVQALIRKGFIKAARFKNSRHKAAYMYVLTPRGLEEKAKLTVEFLQIKVREYEQLRAQIRQMRRDVERHGLEGD